MEFYDFDEWYEAATNKGFAVESWGFCGSKSAIDSNGKVIGEWIADFDTCDGRARGWINFLEE